MDTYQALVSTIALTLGAAWASGINLYAVLLVLGLGSATGNIALPAELQVLENPLVIGAAGFMYCVEFFADKVPGVDSSWDALHTFVRIPAGAMLAAGAVGDTSAALEVAAGILGGGMAAASHATKAGTRLLINTSPEPFSNWGASIGEDVLVLAGLWTALNHPAAFLVLLVVFIAFAVWVLPKIWRLLARILGKISAWLTGSTAKVASTGALPAAATEAQSNLERLKALFLSGALTEQEYAQARERLIRTMPGSTT